ncbi:MAG: hypothetical protein KTR25_17575 [Myxococcales bacterium]|nr:hypothetical protein [Myxococcales bacterium]
MQNPQLLWAVALSFHVLAVLVLTRFIYRWQLTTGIEPIRAVYFNRKLVHMIGCGLPTLAVPYVFTDYWYPTIGGVLLGLMLHIFHSTNQQLYWFQTTENRNDVTFAIMWWVSLSILWWFTNDPWLAILPGLLMSFGDGVTGVARNIYVRTRSKHPIGTACMIVVSIPMSIIVANQASPPLPIWGIVIALVASVVERYEFGVIDDNVLIGVASTLTILAATYIGPMTPL